MNFSPKIQPNLSKVASKPYGRIGSLEVRLAATAEEVGQAIALRQASFASAGEFNNDEFDAFCDHLIVVDTDQSAGDNIVATYRLLGQKNAHQAQGFCARKEFDLSPLIANCRNALEFGRSCVKPEFRSKRTIELLWAGSWAYVLENSVDLMFGCASFEGTNPIEHREALSFLYHHAPVDKAWAPLPFANMGISNNMMKKSEIDLKSAMRKMPPIIKGYLRLGAMFSTHAVVDQQFQTTDILVILPVDRLNPKYVKHYGADAQRHATTLDK